MKTILCPTRGGKESHPNQDFAINLAKERDAGLLFLYVSGISFIRRVGPPIVVDIEKEMDELGEFMLSMAQERAETSGVPARVAVRRVTNSWRPAYWSAKNNQVIGTPKTPKYLNFIQKIWAFGVALFSSRA